MKCEICGEGPGTGKAIFGSGHDEHGKQLYRCTDHRKQLAAIKHDIVEWFKIGEDTVTQQKAIEWGNGAITKGLDGGVNLTASDNKQYVASGKVIVRNQEGVYAVFEGKAFHDIFGTF